MMHQCRWKDRMFIVGLVLVCLSCALSGSHGWSTNNNIQVAPPRNTRQWKQLASLVVNVFDDFTFWEWFQRQQTAVFVLNQYTDTSKRMIGNKYVLLIASLDRKAVGMVEMGISEQGTTVGVLAVSPAYRHHGIATLLLKQCESIACSEEWNSTLVNVQVEIDNHQALKFFTRNGYKVLPNHVMMVKVRRRCALEERPHLLLCKQLQNETAMTTRSSSS